MLRAASVVTHGTLMCCAVYGRVNVNDSLAQLMAKLGSGNNANTLCLKL